MPGEARSMTSPVPRPPATLTRMRYTITSTPRASRTPRAPQRVLKRGYTIMCTTTTAPLQTLSADLNATSTPPDPSDLIAVSSVHLALWRAAVAADRSCVCGDSRGPPRRSGRLLPPPVRRRGS